ncbi:MAG TPA: hypothetical protein VIZ18_17355 [Ktedonobacteraceae bacterium]
MTSFRPHPGMVLRINGTSYEFVQDPLFPHDEQEVAEIEGGEARIYQLRDLARGTLWALKVAKPTHRGEHIARSAAALNSYKDIPGFFLGHRICLTRKNHAALIASLPDLEYAVFMPWAPIPPWRTWAGLMFDKAASARYTASQARDLAMATAHVLWRLEKGGLSHTDIAGGNLILAPDYKRVELLDVEGLYIPDAPPPRLRSRGSPGYQHRGLDQRGQYRPEGDRFAGAILLTEMLTWWAPLVRAHTPDDADSLFQPHELQAAGSARWHAVRNALWSICPTALALFDQAWASDDLAACPDFSQWCRCFAQASETSTDG